MLNFLKGEFREIYRLVLGEAGGKLLRDLFRREVGESASVVAERIKTIIKNNPRMQLAAILLDLSSSDRRKILDVHRAYWGKGKENLATIALGELLPLDAEGKLDEVRARDLYTKLGALPADDLEQFVELLNHDPIAQIFRTFIAEPARAIATKLGDIQAGLENWVEGEEGRRFIKKLRQARLRLRADIHAESNGWWRWASIFTSDLKI